MYGFCATYFAISIYLDATSTPNRSSTGSLAMLLSALTNQGVRQKKTRSDCTQNPATKLHSVSKPALIGNL